MRSLPPFARSLIALLLGLGALFALTLPASAADPIVTSMEVRLPETVTVGDRFTYVITAEVDAGSSVSIAPAGLPDVLRQAGRIETKTRSLPGGRAELTLTLELAAFVTGRQEIPPLKLRARAPGGATTDFETPATVVTVESVLPAGGGVVTPKDLKPQAEIGSAAPIGLYAALGGLVIALLLVGALIVWRMRLLAKVVPVAVVPEDVVLPAEDEARRVLDSAAVMLAAHDYDAYYSTLSTTVRKYLTERFGFPAFALTTTELQERMVRQGIDRWQARLVAGLLNQCDAVVFAQYRPAPDRADADLTAAYEIVEMSRAVEKEEAPVP